MKITIRLTPSEEENLLAAFRNGELSSHGILDVKTVTDQTIVEQPGCVSLIDAAVSDEHTLAPIVAGTPRRLLPPIDELSSLFAGSVDPDLFQSYLQKKLDERDSFDVDIHTGFAKRIAGPDCDQVFSRIRIYRSSSVGIYLLSFRDGNVSYRPKYNEVIVVYKGAVVLFERDGARLFKASSNIFINNRFGFHIMEPVEPGTIIAVFR
jgi:hypothetical protein